MYTCVPVYQITRRQVFQKPLLLQVLLTQVEVLLTIANFLHNLEIGSRKVWWCRPLYM